MARNGNKQVIDELLQPATKSLESFLTSSNKSGSKELDSKIASFFYENTIPFNVADSPSCAAIIEEAMTFRLQNPLQHYKVLLHRILSGELLDKAYSASPFGQRTGTPTPRFATSSHRKPLRNWSVSTNRKLVLKIEDTEELKMSAWDKWNEDV